MKYELTFGTVRYLEEQGINISDIDKQMFSFITGMVSYEERITMAEADAWVEDYLKNGGELKDLTKQIIDSVKSSHFFQTMVLGEKKPQDHKKKPQDHKKKKKN